MQHENDIGINTGLAESVALEVEELSSTTYDYVPAVVELSPKIQGTMLYESVLPTLSTSLRYSQHDHFALRTLPLMYSPVCLGLSRCWLFYY